MCVSVYVCVIAMNHSGKNDDTYKIRMEIIIAISFSLFKVILYLKC